MPQVHQFSTTSDAYDDSQCRDDIRFGDVLVVKPEKVVGFLLSAWPIAVTKKHGSFHSKDPKFSWAQACTRQPHEQNHPDYNLSLAKAQEVARELGLVLDD